MWMGQRASRSNDEAPLAASVPSAEARREEAMLALFQAELEAGFRALSAVRRGVCVFGSARTTSSDPDYQLARAVAARLGADGFAVITGGGPGIMEAANRGARDARALSVGLTIESPLSERINSYVDVPVHFQYVFPRKVVFLQCASVFLVFPGGFGTLDELFELLAIKQTRGLSQPVVLVRRSYWEPLLRWLRDDVLSAGKISSQDLELLAFADDVEEVRARVGDASPKERI